MRMTMRRTIGLSLVLLVVSAPAMSKQVQPGHHHQPPSAKSKPTGHETTVGKSHARRHRASANAASNSKSRHRESARRHAKSLPPPDQHIGLVRVIGKRQIGSAAWYGGRHIGRRTASGERLDTVHATAAHRTLPLHSLVRVTNLSNGRSVVATINDRGPVSRSLLIDLSPRCAKQLDMMSAGIVRVAIEQVAPAPSRTQ
jgi:rare lipoprotein A (peptidoglycan hydrolase)